MSAASQQLRRQAKCSRPGPADCARIHGQVLLLFNHVQVIVRASSFPAAVQKMQRALYEFVVRGVKTNVPFLANVLRHPAFLSGQVSG